ncbi:Bug family tripartite tricarboxylate transporter substrate binding protein [Bordetella tumulicola]|uniref:Bug family tripartite tricarboxylate transporter substrate binding protein n=1 Tax=Bordetella tumulicola TaxID=1649133 RepID=UPI0039F11B72
MKCAALLRRVIAVLAVCSVALPGGVSAQATFPDKPVRVIVPYPAGASLDAVIRPIADAYMKMTGQPMIIENVGGAGGQIGVSQILQAKPDGYTVIMATNAQVSIAPFVYTNLRYDPVQDLVPIVHLIDSTAVLYASAKSPYKTFADVLADPQAKAGTVTFASAGKGTVTHLALELLSRESKIKFNHIPYRGAAPALQDLAGGQVSLLFTFVGSAQSLTASGMVQPLAVASKRRLPGLPNVPTFAELGYPAMQAFTWMGLMAPKGTPESSVLAFNKQIQDILAQPEIKARMDALSTEIRGGAPTAFKAMIAADTERWKKLSTTVNIIAD